MTEQLERELTEMFRERAAQLDVLPARPLADVRRGRLQAGLALASVVAVLAGVMLAGARLAVGGGGQPVTTTATGQRALADLTKALRKTLSGKMVATTNTVEVPSGKFLDAPDLGYSARFGPGETQETRYDGKTGDAVTTDSDGAPTGDMFVHDVVYRHPESQYVGRAVSPLISWISYTKDTSESVQQWRVDSIDTTIPGLVFLYEVPPEHVSERDGRIVVSSPNLGIMRIVSVVQLDRSGGVSAVTTRSILTAPNAVSDRLDRVTFRPLRGAMPHLEVPAPANVMSSARYLAVTQAYREAHKKCTTTPPSTGPDGTRYTAGTRCTYPDGSVGPGASGNSSGSATPRPHSTVPAGPTPTPSPT